MKKIILASIACALLGAGCGDKIVSPLCTSEPETSDIGSLMYPTDSKYEKLGYLGQIFTALDCKDSERAKKIFGFQGESYAAGVTLTWKADEPSANVQAILSTLGFAKTTDGVWQTNKPLTLDALEKLRQLFQDPAELDSLQSADCINCG
jgi:hypothetical protein